MRNSRGFPAGWMEMWFFSKEQNTSTARLHGFPHHCCRPVWSSGYFQLFFLRPGSAELGWFKCLIGFVVTDIYMMAPVIQLCVWTHSRAPPTGGVCAAHTWKAAARHQIHGRPTSRHQSGLNTPILIRAGRSVQWLVCSVTNIRNNRTVRTTVKRGNDVNTLWCVYVLYQSHGRSASVHSFTLPGVLWVDLRFCCSGLAGSLWTFWTHHSHRDAGIALWFPPGSDLLSMISLFCVFWAFHSLLCRVFLSQPYDHTPPFHHFVLLVSH